MLSVAATPIGSIPTMSPTSLPALASECTQAADEFEFRMLEHRLDRGDPHRAGGPLHNP